MTPMISNLIVIALVAAAAVVMGRRAWRLLRGAKTACGCASCPAVKSRGATARPLAGPVPAAAPPPSPAPGASPQRGA